MTQDVRSDDQQIQTAAFVFGSHTLNQRFGTIHHLKRFCVAIECSQRLRSRTQGRATYTMQFARYEEVPRPIAEEIMAKVAGKNPPRAGSR